MSVATEIAALNSNLAAAKSAVTTKGGTVGDTGLAGLASEIATIPSGGGGGGTDWGVLYFHPWTGDWEGYINGEPIGCTASVEDATTFKDVMCTIGLAPEHLVNNPVEGDAVTVIITGQDNGSNVWEITFTSQLNGDTSYAEWDAENNPDWWETNYGLSVTVDSGETSIEFTAVSQYMFTYDTSRTFSLELDQSSYNSLYDDGDRYFGWLPSASVSGFQFGTLATTTPTAFLSFAINLTSLDWAYATSLTSIGASFLQSCSSFNSSITIPSSVTSIGTAFLGSCSSFNSSITIPSSVTTIGASFMGGCSSFNLPITIPSSVTSIGTDFMRSCGAMVSTVYCNAPASVAAASNGTFSVESQDKAAYTTGITLAGTYASDWKAKFPDRNSHPYRKLILAS